MITPLIIEETKKERSGNDTLVDRVNDNLIPLLTSLGYKTEIHSIDEVGAAIILRITKNKKSVFVIPWIRPYLPGKTISKTVADYPRLNIQKSLKNEKDEVKIKTMFDNLKKYNVYFLVMLQKPSNLDMYWFDRYDNIPIEYWKTTYREKGKPLDRIHFPNYNVYQFVKLDKFKNKLIKSLS